MALKFCTNSEPNAAIGPAVRPAVRIDNSLRCTRALQPARYDSRVRQHQGAQISDGHDCTPRCCVMSGPSGAAPLLKTSSMHRTALFRRGRGLLGGLRRAPPGVPASSAGSSDFHTEQHKLLAGLNYQTKFQHNFAGNPEEYESDLVKGCKVVGVGRAYRGKRCARDWRTVPGNCQHCAVLEDAVGRVSACIYVPCCDCRTGDLACSPAAQDGGWAGPAPAPLRHSGAAWQRNSWQAAPNLQPARARVSSPPFTQPCPSCDGAQGWADKNSLKLRRRCRLVWEKGHPHSVLIVKKPGDMAASHKLKEIASWWVMWVGGWVVVLWVWVGAWGWGGRVGVGQGAATWRPCKLVGAMGGNYLGALPAGGWVPGCLGRAYELGQVVRGGLIIIGGPGGGSNNVLAMKYVA